MSPTHWNGRQPRRRSAPWVGFIVPPAMTRAAPQTGRATRQPGYGVAAEKTTEASTMAPRPTDDDALVIAAGNRRS